MAMALSSPANEREEIALYSQTPLMVLRLNTLEILGNYFNSEKLIPSTKGFLRDWRGLASAAQLNFEDANRLKSHSNPTKQIILIWCQKTNDKSRRKISVQDFLECVVSKLDRRDVIEAGRLKELIRSDCLAAKDRLGDISRERIDEVNPAQALTLNDVEVLAHGNSLTQYDTMVLYGDEEEDQLFAKDLIERLERVQLKVFVPDRDLVAGTVEHAASCSIIQERCKKVIAIFSPSFFQSRENKFLTDYAQYVGITQGQNCKIIPIIRAPCDIPSQFKMYTKLPYKPDGIMFNFWDRLICKTMEYKGPLSKELMEYKNYNANRQVQVEHTISPVVNAIRSNSGIAMSSEMNNADSINFTTNDLTLDELSMNTQSTLVSNIESREQVSSLRGQLGAYNRFQGINDPTISQTLSNFSTEDSQVPILPEPPTHEPGRKSKKKEKGKGSFLPKIKNLTKISILKK